jgi:hypothetical protein
MKTLLQISKDHKIAKTTLKYRYERFGFNFKQLLDAKNEALVVKRIHTPTTKLLKKVNPLLVFEFKVQNPYMSNDEISISLAVQRSIIDDILIGEFFIISSKSNLWNSHD